MKLEYIKSDDGQDILQDEDGIHQIMMSWEKPYMEACIDLLKPRGKVLEIGFGMGYSAHRICSHEDVKEYTIVECSPLVWEEIEKFKKHYPELKINVIRGRWEDVLSTCGKFDSIFFDTTLTTTDLNCTFDVFISKCLQNHSHIGTRISCYSDGDPKLKHIKCIDYRTFEYNIDIPENCRYVKGNSMTIPIIRKIKEYSTKMRVGKFKSFC